MTSALTIAVTGATGFLGGHLVRRLRTAGHTVQALTRRAPPNDDDPNLTWVQGHLDSELALKALVKGADVVVHAAGAIKALNRNAFFAVNRHGTRAVLDAAIQAKVPKFVLVSSLAAREPTLSSYAASKRAAEMVVAEHSEDIETVTLRPPAIYGPGDRETARLFQMAANGLVLAPANRSARLSLIHVGDAVTAVQACCEHEQPVQPLEIDDGEPHGYAWEELASAAGSAVNRVPKFVYLPKAVVWMAGGIGTLKSLITRKPSVLTHAKVPELLHADWVAHGPRPAGWSPVWALEKGFDDAVDWYSSQNILKRFF